MTQGEEPFREAGEHPIHIWESAAAAQDPASEQYAGTSLRLQILEIIGSLLNSTGPELEEVRVRMRNLVREHPWDPEIALLMHLGDREQYVASSRNVNIPASLPNASQAMALPPKPSRGDRPDVRPPAADPASPPSFSPPTW